MPFKSKEKEQQWRKENAEHLKKYKKQWRKDNPHYFRDWARRNKNKGIYYSYSEEEKNLIKELYIKKVSSEEISKILGRSIVAIKAKAYKMGFRYKKQWSNSDYKILRSEYKAGKTEKELADILNTTVKSIEWKIKKLDIGSKVGSKEFSKKASERNRKGWDDPNHKFNQLEYRDKLKARWKDPNNIVNSEEYRQTLSDRATFNKNGLKNRNSRGFVNYYGGVREDLGHYVRSRWEANIARYLKWLISQRKIKKYEYEVDCFEFKNIKRGNRSYTPDFKVYLNDGNIEYWEVKGWMDKSSKTKLKRMAKYYPNVKIILIERKQYKEIEKWERLIPNWE